MPLGKEIGLGPGHTVFDRDPVGIQPPQQPLPTFWPMSIVAKRSPISATAELLSLPVTSASVHCLSALIVLFISLDQNLQVNINGNETFGRRTIDHSPLIILLLSYSLHLGSDRAIAR